MLEIIDIHKRYGDRVAACGLSLTLAAGEVVALLGPSGCGKSTLLKLIAGLEAPDAGIVRFDGADLARVSPDARGFALMFQDFALFPHLDVLGNVMFGLRERRVAREEARTRACAMLAELGLDGYQARRVWTLSGGEAQRVALARALVTRPRLLLLDEPFSSLDAHLRQGLQQDFRRLLGKQGIPALLVTHDRAEAFAMADRVALLCDGRIQQCATPAALLAAPATPWVARFIGYENLLSDAVVPERAFRLGAGQAPARVEDVVPLAEGMRVRVETALGRFVLTLSAREVAACGGQLHPGGEIGVGIDRDALLRFDRG
ncbi:ABC transporter ATP-binding protein [Paludibacterium yongneupense]|uniref:ABC transporter ATP-binding protein n=1 Tax=Paludibacterium yongneupense TaxID=400061 RepID=UPI0004165A1F|nr:ABC transporter ATP-binding protein [Paludibacterium yongneupense]